MKSGKSRRRESRRNIGVMIELFSRNSGEVSTLLLYTYKQGDTAGTFEISREDRKMVFPQNESLVPKSVHSLPSHLYPFSQLRPWVELRRLLLTNSLSRSRVSSSVFFLPTLGRSLNISLNRQSHWQDYRRAYREQLNSRYCIQEAQQGQSRRWREIRG